MKKDQGSQKQQESWSDFDKWLIRKDRLERGREILFRLSASTIFVEDSDEKEHLTKRRFKDEKLDEIILASAAIDCSMNILEGNLSDDTNNIAIPDDDKKKSMKMCLRSWLIRERFTFDELSVDRDSFDKFSDDEKELLFHKENRRFENTHDTTTLTRMISCGYTIPKRITTDQKLQNTLYINEFNQRWNDGVKKLIEKCVGQFQSSDETLLIAESKDELEKGIRNDTTITEKMMAKCTDSKEEGRLWKQCVHSETKESRKSTQYYSEGKELFHLRNRFNSEDIGHIKQDSSGILLSKCFGVSERKFQCFLSFGINYFIRLEKEYEKRIKAIECLKKLEKTQDAKRAHEIWLENKRRNERFQKEKNNQHHDTIECAINPLSGMMNHPHLLMSPRLLGAKNEGTRILVKRRISSPKIFIQLENITDNSSVALIQWKHLGHLSSSDFFMVTVGKINEYSPSKVWRDPTGKGGKPKLSQKIDLSTSVSYWVSIKICTASGISPENRVIIPSRPDSPSAPILLNASESTIKISWIAPKSSRKMAKGDNYCESYRYNVSLCVDDEKDLWISVWKGHSNVATISGLNCDTAYRLRVICTNAIGLQSPPGESSIVFTSLQALPIPKLLSHDSDSIELSWEAAKLGKDDTSRGSSVSLCKVFNSVDIDKNGWIEDSKLNDLLCKLCIVSCEGSSNNLKALSSTGRGKVSFNDFKSWWNSHVTYFVTQHEQDEENSYVVYSGPNTSVNISGLAQNTDFYFNVSCVTIRGSSLPSASLHVKTLPGPPINIALLHVEATMIILKIWFHHECKIKVEKIEEFAGKSGIDTQHKLSTVYEGNSNIVKITSLRSNKSYKFRCQCVNNIGGKSSYLSSGEIQTTRSQFILDPKRIASLFTIDCTNDIIQGDLIFFTEQDGQTDDFCTVCIVARVLLIHQRSKARPEELIKMEISWIKDDRKRTKLKVGMMVERRVTAVNKFEVLRIPWIDEMKRK